MLIFEVSQYCGTTFNMLTNAERAHWPIWLMRRKIKKTIQFSSMTRFLEATFVLQRILCSVIQPAKGDCRVSFVFPTPSTNQVWSLWQKPFHSTGKNMFWQLCSSEEKQDLDTRYITKTCVWNPKWRYTICTCLTGKVFWCITQNGIGKGSREWL